MRTSEGFAIRKSQPSKWDSVEKINAICENPLDSLNSKLLFHMLSALHTFNEFSLDDKAFLTNVFENSSKRGMLTEKQATWVGKKLLKYVFILVRIALAAIETIKEIDAKV